jgi:hypothetical protein
VLRLCWRTGFQRQRGKIGFIPKKTCATSLTAEQLVLKLEAFLEALDAYDDVQNAPCRLLWLTVAPGPQQDA